MKLKIDWDTMQQLNEAIAKGEHLVVLFYGGYDATIETVTFDEYLRLKESAESGMSDLISVSPFFQVKQ